tara:strand:- start:5759 stop:7420 length:1662 start_codon:yes stop_codon:yes gene_type:complete
MRQLKKIYYLLDSIHQKKIPVFIFLTLIGTFLEILSIGLIIPLVSSLLQIEKIYFLNLSFLSSNFHYLVFFLLLIYLLKSLFLIYYNYWQFKFVFDINLDLSSKMFGKYLNMSYLQYLKKSSPELVRNIINIENFSHNIINTVVLISEIFLIFCFCSILLFFQPKIIVTSLFIGFIISYIFLKVINPKIVNAGIRYQDQSKKLIEQVNQSLNSIKEIKISQKENFFYDKFFNDAKLYSNSIKLNEFLKTVPRILIEFISISIVLIILLVMVMNKVLVSEIITFIALFGAIGFRFIPSFNKVIASIQHLKFYLRLTENLSKDLKIENVSKETSIKVDFRHEIKIKDLSFYYDENNKVLKDLNISIKKNSIIGIVGKTGSGKSTLVNILIGLLKPSKGVILVDEKPLNLFNSSWFSKIGYVPQRILLNEGTIKENIAFGISQNKIDNEKVNNALKLSQLWEFIQSIGGVDANVKELGKNFSGGQIQRIGIARALYNDPEILILDEATSNLDKETSKSLIQSIKSIRNEKTIVIISHDETSIEICDYVYNLNKSLK